MQRRAFSLIELFVVIGIIMVLIGFVAPLLGKARFQAKGIKWAQQIHSNSTLVTIHQKDVFPIAARNWGCCAGLGLAAFILRRRYAGVPILPR